MEFRREKSKTFPKRRESEELFEDELLPKKNKGQTSTPVRGAGLESKSEEEESPCFTGFTQELLRDDVDVLWDYSSPQSRIKKTISRKPKKKLNLTNQPTVVATSRSIRRHNSNNIDQIKQDFCELRQELMALKAEIAKPDHEESLILSPREEEAFMRTQDRGFEDMDIGDFDIQVSDQVVKNDTPYIGDIEDDPFDDGMDDHLIMFSQQVEKQIEQNCDINKPSTSYQCGISKTESKRLTESFKTKEESNISEVLNDSFDQVISQMAEEDLDQLTQVVDLKQYRQNSKISIKPNTNSKVFPRSRSENIVTVSTVTQNTPRQQKPSASSSKMQLQRTHSFESYTTSPIKCSPEEIEKKRRQALAKLEAKRVQELIERNKQEALKRREESKRRLAQQQKKIFLTRRRM